MLTTLFELDLGRYDVIMMSVLPALVNFAIFIYVLYFLQQSITNNVFAIFVFLVGCWQLGDAMVRLSISSETAMEWSRLSGAFIIFVIPFGVLFTLSITRRLGENSSRMLFTGLFIPPIVLLVPTIARLDTYTVRSSDLWYWIVNPEPVPATYIIYAWITLGALFNLGLFWFSYLRVEQGQRKEMQLLLLAVGYTIPCIGGIVLEVLFPLFFGLNDIPVTTSLITTFSVASIIAIKRFWLFEYSPKQKWEQILESMNEGVLIVDNDDHIMYANQMFCEVVGYSFDEIRGKVANEMFLDDLDKSLIKKVIEERKGKKSEKYDIQLKSKSGEKIWVNMSGSPYTDAAGRVIGSIGIQTNISKEREAEKKIRESEENLQAIFENTSEGFILADRDGVIRYFNDKARETVLLNAVKDVEAGINIYDFVDANRLPGFRELIHRVLDGETIQYDRSYPRADGKVTWLNFTINPVHDDGHINGFCITGRDITDRKASEEMQALIMSSALDAIVCMNPDGEITFWNPQAERIFGWPSGDVLGQKISETIIPARYRTRHDEGIKRYLQTGENHILNRVFEITAMQRDQKEFPIEMTIIHLQQPGHQFFCAFIKDISERKESEEKLRSNEERLKQAQAIAHVGNWEVNFETNTAIWSDEAYRIYGLKPGQPIKAMDSWLSFVHHEDLEFVNSEIIRSQESFSNFSFYHRIVRADEVTRYVFTEGRYEFAHDGKAVGLYGVVHDVTEEKMAEDKLVELNEKLARRAKELAVSNEELEQFAYIASHDLQEPLRMVTSFLTQLENKYKDQLDDRAKEYIYFATDGAVRMRQIILDLLEYSRVGRKEAAQPVDMNLLLKQTVLLNRVTIEEKGAVIEWDNLPVINAGATLRQVVQNLVGNALKYQKGDNKPHLVISATETPAYWQFAFRDNGIGIDEKFFEKIFVVFQRLHNREKYSGTGIGLAICKKIVENHGGSIWVESKPGQGSTFYFTIAKNALTN